MKLDGKYKSVLCISDLHQPYTHPDTFSFLKAIAREYSPDLVVCLGDELDFHAISFHKSNVDLFSAGDELKTAISRLQPFYEFFPKVHVLDSNHGSLVYRRLKDAGIPLHVVKSFREVINAPKGWKWHEDLLVTMSNGQEVYFCHGRSNNVLKESQLHSQNFVSGHWHSTFEIKYWANKNSLYWGMSCGCLVDQSSMAFEYAKNFSKKFIVGTGIIIEGIPRLVPMVLDKHGRWIGRLIC
jgi:UDP-2,3-diacylglucosamine pyrophosphatase LpxH